MERLRIEQLIPASPAAVWPLISDPARMNRWSKAPIRLLDPGDGGGPGDVGALRRIEVHALGRKVSFDEVIVASEPPHRLGYRVFRGLPVRVHRGEIQLHELRRGTQLVWDVEFEFYLPGLGRVARAILERQLADSVAAIVQEVRHDEPVRPSTPRALPRFDLGPLRERASSVLDEQRALADALQHGEDPKYWFARVYQYVTEAQLSLCDKGAVAHVDWVLALIPEFHRYYAGNLEHWVDGDVAAVERPWQRAFRRMEIGGARHDAMTTAEGLLLAVEAHIEEDLPRALAEVWARRYRQHASFVRFRGDYLSMGEVFLRAADRLIAEMPRRFVPSYIRAARALLPAEIPDAIVHARFYDVPGRRLLAFERGRRFAETLARALDHSP
ncbi:MAG: SRPBCC family protein [Deltaproteobacteria bacterium]|nr:SRPBCC family protein [Deltaproteobacteria bacterium]